MSNRKTVQKWMDDIRSGLIAGMFAGPPWETWSSLRWRQSDDQKLPPVLRTALEPWGLPKKSSRHLLQVATGNQLLQVTLLMALRLLAVGGFAGIEHPAKPRFPEAAASFWKLCYTQWMATAPATQIHTFDQGPHGQVSKKPTTMLLIRLPTAKAHPATYQGGDRQDFEGTLLGKDAKGNFKSAYLLGCVEVFHDVLPVYSTFSDFISRWTWPARLGANHLAEIFTEARAEKHRKAKHIKCQASDLLSLIGVLAHFTKTVLTSAANGDANCINACSAFLALVDVCELVALTASDEVMPAKLLGTVHRFLELFVKAFGFDWMTPKLHWQLHFAETLEKNGRLFNCFCLERKHRVPKSYAEDYKSITRQSSTSILSEIICHHLSKLSDQNELDFTIGLVRGRPCPRKARKTILRFVGEEFSDDPINVASVARINIHETVSKGDVVLMRDDGDIKVGRVAQHLSIDDNAFSLIHPWKLIRRVGTTELYIYSTSADADLWKTSDILGAVEHIVFPNGSVGILMPLRYRA